MNTSYTILPQGSRLPRIARVILLLSMLTIPLYLALASYYRIDIAASIIWKGDDGWCNIGSESLGVHCFGDWNERVGLDYSNKSIVLPWKDNLELSPVGPFITKLGQISSNLLGQKLTLAITIMAYALSIMSPFLIRYYSILRSNKLLNSHERNILTLAMPICSIPFLTTIDRLNNIALAVPCIYALLVFCREKSKINIAIMIIALASLKPQFCILSLVLFDTRNFRPFLMALSGSVIVVSVLIMIPGNFSPYRIQEYIHALRTYSGISIGSDISPPNLATSILLFPSNKLFAFLTPIVFLALSLITLKRKSLVFRAVLYLCISTFMFGRYVSAYYTCIFIPIAAFAFFNARLGSNNVLNWDKTRSPTSLKYRREPLNLFSSKKPKRMMITNEALSKALKTLIKFIYSNIIGLILCLVMKPPLIPAFLTIKSLSVHIRSPIEDGSIIGLLPGLRLIEFADYRIISAITLILIILCLLPVGPRELIFRNPIIDLEEDFFAP